MEEQIYQNEPAPEVKEVKELKITPEAKLHLATTIKWAKFIGIFYAVMVGFLLLFGILMTGAASKLSSLLDSGVGAFPASMMGIMYIVMAIIVGGVYAFPLICLFNFVSKIKKALAEDDTPSLTEALNYQKMMYTYMGVLALIGLCSYALMFIIGGIALAVASAL